MSISRPAEDVPDASSEVREGQMTGTLINDITEIADTRLGIVVGVRLTIADEFPLDDNTSGEPLDEMERRTR